MQPRIEVKEASVVGFVELDVSRVRSGLRIEFWREALCAAVAVDGADSDTGDQGGANTGALRGVLVLSLTKGPVKNVCQHLTPQRTRQSVSGRDQPVELGAATGHGVDNLAKGEGDSLQECPNHVPGTVAEGETDEGPFGVRVHKGGTLTDEVWQEDEPFRPRLDLSRDLVHLGVGQALATREWRATSAGPFPPRAWLLADTISRRARGKTCAA